MLLEESGGHPSREEVIVFIYFLIASTFSNNQNFNGIVSCLVTVFPSS